MSESVLPGISDRELIKRAVKTARARKYRKNEKHPRWVAVQDVFQTGSTFAHELCRTFGLDPDEEVAR